MRSLGGLLGLALLRVRSSYAQISAADLASLASTGAQLASTGSSLANSGSLASTATTAGTTAAKGVSDGAAKEAWSAFLSAAQGNLQTSSMANYFKIGDSMQAKDVDAVNSELTSYGGPQEIDGNTVFSVGLASSPKVTQTNAANLFSALFGFTPNFDEAGKLLTPSEIGNQFKQAFGSGSLDYFSNKANTLISGASGAFQSNCAWQVTVSSKAVNIALPDGNSVYHVQILQNFGPSDVIMLQGQFPDVRYFSIQTYDQDYQPIASMRDLDIKAYKGTNPFRNKTSNVADNGYYRVYITKDGQRGYANELPAATGDYSSSDTAMIVMRMYGLDPLAPTPTDSLADWGYVQPATVSTKSYGSTVPTAYDSSFNTLSACPANNSNALTQLVKTIVETNLVNRNKTCKAENLEDGFMLWSSAQSSDKKRAPFNSKDNSYLLACGNNRPDYIANNYLIAEVSAYMPSTPNSKYAQRFTGDHGSFQARYVSISAYDLNLPGPLIKTYSDDEIRKFYYGKYGANTWETNFGRNVSMLFGKNEALIKKCGFTTDESLVVPIENSKGVVPEWWGIIYRHVLDQSQVIRANNSLRYGLLPEEIWKQGTVDALDVMCSKATNPGDECDQNPYRVGSIMKQYYPRVKWWVCDENGVKRVAESSANPFDTKYRTFSGAPPSSQYWYKFCNADVNQAMVKMYAPTTLMIHYAGQPANASMPNFLAFYPIMVSTQQKSVVVGVSPKASAAGDAYFRGEVSLCGYTYVTDPKWRCSPNPPADSTWLIDSYDDSLWEPAAIVNQEFAVDGLDSTSKFITSRVASKSVYCRLVIPNPTYSPITSTS